MKELFDKISWETSKITTLEYSTSFSMGIKVFAKNTTTLSMPFMDL